MARPPGVVPGMNVAAVAMTAIWKQTITYYRNTGRELSAIGTFLSTYADPLTIRGSWQFQSRKVIEKLGLQLNATYAIFYSEWQNVVDIQRDMSGDVLIYGGNQYNVIQTPSDWDVEDNWVGVWCVKVPNTLDAHFKKKVK